VRGGLVVYATDLKSRLAFVDHALLADVGAVHPDVAAQLAAGARRTLGADWGVGITGVAGPDRQDDQPVGTVFAAVDGPNGVTVADARHTGDRDEIRAAAVRQALQLLADAVRGTQH
jgi:nicotinamide-nucleotide amidase